MPFYHGLKEYSAEKADWISRRLIDLREDLHREIIQDRQPNSLIIGSWNIRAFDGGVPRLDESLHYIAEIISAFDICAVQEVKTDLGPLKKIKDLLGPNWEYFVTDVSDHKGGNYERMAFFYNMDKVFFRRLVGEIVIDENKLSNNQQISRSPFFAAFQAGWFRFTLVSAHIYYGKADDASRRIRGEEIDQIGKVLIKRARAEDQVYIFLGDLNIEKKNGIVMEALRNTKLQLPGPKSSPGFDPSSMDGKKPYDQMAYTTKGASTRKTRELRHGTFDWRDAVFPHSDPKDTNRPSFEEFIAHYQPKADANRQKYKEENNIKPDKSPIIFGSIEKFKSNYKRWTTDQMSDHLPIWLELETDYSDDYLRRFHDEAQA